jgi:hypothetical protein
MEDEEKYYPTELPNTFLTWSDFYDLVKEAGQDGEDEVYYQRPVSVGGLGHIAPPGAVVVEDMYYKTDYIRDQVEKEKQGVLKKLTSEQLKRIFANMPPEDHGKAAVAEITDSSLKLIHDGLNETSDYDRQQLGDKAHAKVIEDELTKRNIPFEPLNW